MDRQTVARVAEEFVAKELDRAGWRILARNLRHHGFELDLVAMRGGTIAFVEVKSRKFPLRLHSETQALVGWRKQCAMMRGVRWFLARRQPRYHTLRFDLAVVYPSRSGRKIQYFPGIWEPARGG